MSCEAFTDVVDCQPWEVKDIPAGRANAKHGKSIPIAWSGGDIPTADEPPVKRCTETSAPQGFISTSLDEAGYVTAKSWTGSESKRSSEAGKRTHRGRRSAQPTQAAQAYQLGQNLQTPQRFATPIGATRKPLHKAFVVLQGAPAQVRRIGEFSWQDHTTAHNCYFEASAGGLVAQKVYQFTQAGWQLRVASRFVRPTKLKT